jgi:L-asparaginase II
MGSDDPRGRAARTPAQNCSGKHAGFLTVARHWNIATHGYEHIAHPAQQAVAAALSELSGLNDLPWGVDGCTAPNFALPVSAFAKVLAKFADPSSLVSPRKEAVTRVVHAMIAHPDLVSGTGRACAILMRASHGRAAVKTGAEGFYAGIIPSLGLGIALKIDDGAGRAAETTIATLLDKLGVLGDEKRAQEIVCAPVTNTRGEIVGERRAASALAEAAI